jgi:hypothetical protein
VVGPRPLGVEAAASPQHSNTRVARTVTAVASAEEVAKVEVPRRQINFFSSLGRVHRGGDAFPFRRQAGKIMGQSGKIAIDRNGMAAWCVSRRIFQRRG